MSTDGIDVASVLDNLCVELGFCLPPDEQSRLCASPPPDVEAFTDAVFSAEGMNPNQNKHLRESVRQRVIRAFQQK
ncbi:hypothetical protein [Nocardia sp. NPDC057030]|uniref:hypothetical protein n=1 Tax=unclassified Nocardia TaxID=2637762 RepID=UPI00362AA76D